MVLFGTMRFGKKTFIRFIGGIEVFAVRYQLVVTKCFCFTLNK